jgi:hypothetical protein
VRWTLPIDTAGRDIEDWNQGVGELPPLVLREGVLKGAQIGLCAEDIGLGHLADEGDRSRSAIDYRRNRLRGPRQRLRSPRHRLRFQSSANLSPASSITLAPRAIRIVGRDIRVPLVVLARLARDVQAAVDISHFGT